MPIPLAPLVGWLLGLALAWVARADRGWEESPLITSRPFAVSAAFAGLVYAPIVAYYAAFHRDWTYLYAVPGRTIPSAVDLALVLLASASIPLGLAAGARVVRAHTMRPLVKLGAGPFAIALVLVAVFARRLAVSGSYAQFHQHVGTEPIATSALGRGVLAAAIALSAATLLSIRALKKPA